MKATSAILRELHRYGNRRIGKTRVLIELCKEVDGTLICKNHSEAHTIAKTYGINAISVDEVYRDRTEGWKKPTVFDQHVFDDILENAVHEVSTLETRLRSADREIDRLQNRWNAEKEDNRKLVVRVEGMESILETCNIFKLIKNWIKFNRLR